LKIEKREGKRKKKEGLLISIGISEI